MLLIDRQSQHRLSRSARWTKGLEFFPQLVSASCNDCLASTVISCICCGCSWRPGSSGHTAPKPCSTSAVLQNSSAEDTGCPTPAPPFAAGTPAQVSEHMASTRPCEKLGSRTLVAGPCFAACCTPALALQQRAAFFVFAAAKSQGNVITIDFHDSLMRLTGMDL